MSVRFRLPALRRHGGVSPDEHRSGGNPACAAFGGSQGSHRADVGDRPAWWMVQMAGDKSEFHWYGTFALILAPGLFVGALIGLAEHRRRTGGSPSRWLTLSPCLFLAALATRRSLRR
jgi:hypothetical protein